MKDIRCRFPFAIAPRRTIVLVTGLAAMSTILCDSALAQTDSDVLPEVVVTAEKRESTVQSTPLSITAVSGAQLQSQGITDVMDVARQIPGISMRSAGPGQTELEMRGMASSGGSSPTVGFYLDETPLTPPAAALNGKVVIDPDLFDLARVEVLRGPQGTLYGAGSMGGTIKLITNAPDPRRIAASAEGILSHTNGGGTNNTLNGMLNLPLIEGKLALRLVATDKHDDGWLDRIVTSPFPVPTQPCAQYSEFSFNPNWGCVRGDVQAAPHTQTIHGVNWHSLLATRVALLGKPTDELTIDATFMYQRLRAGGYDEYDQPLPQEPVVLAHFQPFDIAEPFFDTFHLGSLTVKYDLGWSTLTSDTSYWTRDEKQSQDISEALRSNYNVFYGVDILAPILFTEEDLSNQLSEELRLASSDSGKLTWIGGVFFSKLKSVFWDTNGNPAFADASTGGAAANPDGIVYDSYNPYHVTQYAIFGESGYRFTDQWRLTLGLRWFHFKTDVNEEQAGGLTASGNATPTLANFTTSVHAFAPKINLGWLPSENLTAYALIAKGFRPGGVNLPLPPFCQAQTETYNPDTSWNYEVGEKARMFDNRVSLNADFYYIRWHDVQQLYNQSCGYSLTANIGDAHSYGPEIEMTARLTSRLLFALNGAYTKAAFTSVKAAVSEVSTTALTVGTPILNIPKYTGNASLTYTQPVSDDVAIVSRVSDSYVGPATDISFAYVPLASYNLVGARMGVDASRWSAFVFVDNATNSHARLTTNTTSFSWVIPSVTRISTNQPRTFGLDASYRF
jgi:outer membrane receptor protein involved in Fe transport